MAFDVNTYEAWAECVQIALGITRPEERDTILIWADGFRRLGFSPAELNRAALDILFSRSPEYTARMSDKARLAEVRQAIIRHCHDARRDSLGGVEADRRKRELDEREEARQRCPHCDDTGLVLVPHRGYVRLGDKPRWVPFKVNADGVGIYYQQTVRCNRCEAGNRWSDTRDDRKRELLTIDRYEELVCGFWRELVADVEREREEKLEIVTRMVAAEARADESRMAEVLAGIVNEVAAGRPDPPAPPKSPPKAPAKPQRPPVRRPPTKPDPAPPADPPPPERLRGNNLF